MHLNLKGLAYVDFPLSYWISINRPKIILVLWKVICQQFHFNLKFSSMYNATIKKSVLAKAWHAVVKRKKKMFPNLVKVHSTCSVVKNSFCGF